MAGTRRCVTVLVVMCMCLWGSTEAVGGAKSRPRPRPRPRPQQPTKKPEVDLQSETSPAQNIDIQQMGGKWYLLNTASKCSYLLRHGTKVEATVVTLTTPATSDAPLSISTKTRHNHHCWEILQVYHQTPTPGRLLLKGLRPEHNTDVVIAETDYRSYAIIYYHKYGKITMKLYGRSVDDLSEPVLERFEQRAERQGMGLAYLFQFPTYSHCGSVDNDHIINCVPTC